MGWTADLLTGLADRVAAVTGGSYDADGTSGDVVLGSLPDELAQGISVQGYNLQPDHDTADVIQPVQFWLRGPAAWVRDTADAIFDDLEGAVDQTIGGIAVPLITLHSDAPLGIDGRRRTERAVNYDIHANRPTTARPE